MRLSARIMIWLGIFLATFALWAVTSHADEMDIYDTFPIDQKCGFEVKTFLGAVESRESGHARKILHIDRDLMDQMIADGRVKKDEYGRVYMPMDGMYVNNWNTVSQRTRDFMERIIFFGWDMADAHIKKDLERVENLDPEWKGKINALIDPKTKNEWATAFYETCLQQRASEKRVEAGGFVKTQSQHLADPINYEALELVLEGCRANLPIYFHKCITKDDYSVEELKGAVKSCNVIAWDKFFSCQISGGFPYQLKKSLQKEIEEEVGGNKT